jgi:predicted nucleotidyltransferase
MNNSMIGNALFTKTQQQVLSLLFGRPEHTYYLNEIARLAAVGKGSVSRELERLCTAGLLTVSKQGNQNHYQANPNSPIFSEVKAIVQKTFGITDVIKTAIAPLLPQLTYAFIYGSIAQGTEHANSDIDLMLVGDDISYGAVMELLVPAKQQLSRKINPTLYTTAEFQNRKATNQHFIKRVMEQPKLWLKGEKI